MHARRSLASSAWRLDALAITFVLAAAVRSQQSILIDGPAANGLMATWDIARDRLVWFGADGGTWEVAAGRLLQRAVDGPSPPPRAYGVLVYDLARARTFLFGGQAPTAAWLNDTWTWDGAQWTQLLGGPQPPPRIRAAACYDVARRRIVLFGGDAPTGPLTDTWEHDGTQWIARAPATVVPWANGQAMAYDILRSVAVMVRVQGLAPAETWEWNGTDWTLRATTGLGMEAESIAFDVARARTVMIDSTNGLAREWDGSSWQSAPLPSTLRRSRPAVLFRPASARIVIAGGLDRIAGFATDVWEWDGAALRPLWAGQRPQPRGWELWVADETRREIVQFGGFQQPSGSDTWVWNGTTWSLRLPTRRPLSEQFGAACWDGTRQLVLWFGGVAGGFQHDDLWGWDGSDWTQLDAGSGPSPRERATMAWDPVRGLVVLFGGASSTHGFLGDTWEWNGTSWTSVAPAAAPSPRGMAAMTYDAGLGRTLLYGGHVGWTANVTLVDAWEYDGATWRPLQTWAPPPRLGRPTLHYEPAFGRTLLFGRSFGATPASEVWTLSFNTWALLSSITPAPWVGQVALDPRRRRYVANAGEALVEFTTTPARVQSIGSGCGTLPPRLAVRTRPRFGDAAFGFETIGDAGLPAVFALGDAQANVPLGNGCTLLVGGSTAVLFGSATTFFGAEVALPIPANVALRGLTLFAQAAVLDPRAANGFGLTQGLSFTVGD